MVRDLRRRPQQAQGRRREGLFDKGRPLEQQPERAARGPGRRPVDRDNRRRAQQVRRSALHGVRRAPGTFEQHRACGRRGRGRRALGWNRTRCFEARAWPLRVSHQSRRPVGRHGARHSSRHGRRDVGGNGPGAQPRLAGWDHGLQDGERSCRQHRLVPVSGRRRNAVDRDGGRPLAIRERADDELLSRKRPVRQRGVPDTRRRPSQSLDELRERHISSVEAAARRRGERHCPLAHVRLVWPRRRHAQRGLHAFLPARRMESRQRQSLVPDDAGRRDGRYQSSGGRLGAAHRHSRRRHRRQRDARSH